MLDLNEKMAGCITGAVLGTEMGMLRMPLIGKEIKDAEQLKEAIARDIDWGDRIELRECSMWGSSLTPLIKVMASAYVNKQGRVTPEDFAAELVADTGLASRKAQAFLDIYSAIERLREGMQPRINGIGACPCGNITTAMPIVGIYHAGDPEYAYIDGIELASVMQRAPATEWAALAAAAVAYALSPGCTAQALIKKIMEMAFKYCKDVYYEISLRLRATAGMDEERLLGYYAALHNGQIREYMSHNPLMYILPLLGKFENEPAKVLRVLCSWHYPEVRASVAGAIIGALYGKGGIGIGVTGEIDAIAASLQPMLGVAAGKRGKDKKTAAKITEVNSARSKSGDGESALYDKVLGCILAGAIGNAMGSPVEGCYYWEIDKQHPGGIRTVLDPSKLESEDDNQVAMMLIEAYIARDGLPATARDYGAKWAELMDKDMFWACLQNSYELIRGGMDPRICGHWNLVTGSSVMCMEPVGIYHLGDIENAYIDGTAMSYLNQRGLDVIAAAILSAATAEALTLNSTPESVVQAALAVAPRGKLLTFDTREIDNPYDYISKCAEIARKHGDVFSVRKELYDKCLLYHPIDPLELLGFAFAMLLVSKGDVREAAIGGTNIGRDSDTIAGRGAMLAGAISGAGNIPKEWVDMMNAKSIEKIKANTRRITDLIVNKKLAAMSALQEARL